MIIADDAAGPAVQLAQRSLADLIRRGAYPPASRLPGERDLASSIGVSRTTVRQALRRLADQGLVTAASQRGWFIAKHVLSEPPSVLMSFTEMALGRGLQPLTEVLHGTLRRATFDEAARMAIAPAAPVFELRRRRNLDQVPVCIDTNVLCTQVDALQKVDFTNRSLYEILRTTCGITVARCAYTVQAVSASDDIATLLGIGPGEPVLYGEETSYAADGSPIACGTTFYRGDAYRFQADLYASPS